MPKRADYVSAAQALLTVSEKLDEVDAVATALEAQAHATLALVEQQRTANLIAAINKWGGEANAWPLTVREGLGLE